MRHRSLIHFCTVIFLFRTCAFCAGGEPIVTTDLLRIRSVASIDVARDGSRAVFAVRSIGVFPPPPPTPTDPQPEPTYKNQSHLFVLELTGGAEVVRQLTFGDRSDGSPRFSPDGKRIVFVRDASAMPSTQLSNTACQESDSNSQIWMIGVDGGEARQITNFKHGCDNPIFSPDGRRLLVTSAIPLDELDGAPPWPMERPKRTWKDSTLPEGVKPRPDGSRAQIRAWLDRNSSRLNPNAITRLEFQDETNLRGTMRFSHLYLVNVDLFGGASPAISPYPPLPPCDESTARRITNGFYDHTQAAFMPDGQSIVYAAKKPTDQHIDRMLSTSLWRVNIDGVNDHAILSVEGWSLNSPKPSRDGLVIAFTGHKMDEPAFRQTQLGLASIKGELASDPVWLTEEATFPASVHGFEWSPTQAAAIIFNTAMRGGFPLMTISAGLVQPAVLVSEFEGRPVGVHAFAAGGGSIVYSVCSASNPCVLAVRDGRGDRTVYDLNPWTTNKTLSLPQQGEITRPDGMKIQYWLMEPTNREPGPPPHKYPLCLQIHGGPSAMWGPGEFTMWHEFQLLCSWGYGVVYCNPRGSGGYGYEFQKKNFQDWGDGPAGDVLAVLEHASLKDWVDQDKLVIAGGSYAGYLTTWIIARDRRFKAAVAQRGVYDFDTFFGEGNAWRLVAWSMGGNPYDPRVKHIIDRNNPFTYVTRIKTPLLIEHGSNDLRTGVSQSEMLYRALKEMNQPVEYVRYPNASHDMSRSGDPLQRMDRLNRIIEFFERFIDNNRAAPVASSN